MVRECQKRAMKKWQQTNKEHLNEYIKLWRDNNPEYRDKQSGYVLAHRFRKKFGDEFYALCCIEIF